MVAGSIDSLANVGEGEGPLGPAGSLGMGPVGSIDAIANVGEGEGPLVDVEIEESEEIKYPHTMYNCKTGEAFEALNPQMHMAMESLGYVHNLDECEIEEQENEFVVTPPQEANIDPSVEGDVISIVESPTDEGFTYQEVKGVRIDSQNIFQTFSIAGNVDLNNARLYAYSDEDISSEFFIRIKENTRATFAVRLDYNNKAIDRKPLYPNDWAEEFDLILEGGDEIRWNVPKQDEKGIAITSYKIDNPVQGKFSLILNGNERIDQSSPFWTYHTAKDGTEARARGEISIRLSLVKYEVGTEITQDEDEDGFDDDEPQDENGGGGQGGSTVLEDDELFGTSDVILGLGVMLLLGLYLVSILDVGNMNVAVPEVA